MRNTPSGMPRERNPPLCFSHYMFGGLFGTHARPTLINAINVLRLRTLNHMNVRIWAFILENTRGTSRKGGKAGRNYNVNSSTHLLHM